MNKHLKTDPYINEIEIDSDLEQVNFSESFEIPLKDKTKRANRRQKNLNVKVKAKKIYKEQGDKAIKYADHLKTCSCHMCGNQRRYAKGEEKLTMQERKFKQEKYEE